MKAATLKKTKARQPKRKLKDNTDKLLTVIIDSIEDKKGERIVVLNLKELSNAMADYFIICQASNKTQVEAIVRNIEEKVEKKLKETAAHIEGKQNAEWILMDYFNVIVHVFLADKRDFYSLEKLWADAPLVKFAAQ
ncbi:MAG: ribosome silencing factor [Bacteroidia bacterium]|nr:ribosome silencing factor [Bacteroidia bacterium]MCW5919571.1 ribosome silencing factor [Bacteroidota bacterium]